MIYAASTLLLLSVVNQTASSSLRILGGTDADPTEYPYVVRFEILLITKNYNETVNLCTAAVIKPTWTITAAHCADTYISGHYPDFHKRAGTIQSYKLKSLTPSSSYKTTIKYGLPDQYSTSKVLRTVEYPNKKNTHLTLENILLLETEPIYLTTYGKISAVDYNSLYGNEMLILGYGLSDSDIGLKENVLAIRLKKPLQIAKGLLMKCTGLKAIYPMVCLVHACTGHPTVCPGDSGGPLLHPSGIVGVLSKADVNNCGFGNTYNHRDPDQYVPVSAFIDWIAYVTV